MWRPGALWCTRALLGAPRLGLGAPRCSQVGPEGLSPGCFQKGDFGGILVGATRWGLCAPKCSGLCGSTLVGCSQVLRPCGSTRDLGCSQKGAPRAAPRKGHQNEPTGTWTYRLPGQKRRGRVPYHEGLGGRVGGAVCGARIGMHVPTGRGRTV